LPDTYLSSRHARVANDDGDLSIEDLGSTNGTYVNQELVKGRVRLERGDVVQVGGVLFEVVR
jgi:pSer/pThr/pTyr-binding forkhead associated (FHA) protein